MLMLSQSIKDKQSLDKQRRAKIALSHDIQRLCLYQPPVLSTIPIYLISL